ncbi:pre-mRNA-splicing factor 38B isoform X1 [Rhipicephalus sanguineus]|uniref:pre-mRNA-splicing factor 38B isoform X1 n=1 Tax=Rhipicephalus sanguineus TaxID=34632 RepID=UPI0018951833|nr:pre-mRNA-splicing factor 38B isoform X1 [Rhipicephalus sanguineus]
MAPGGPAEKKNNVLPLWGNDKTMNLNNLILTNILSSPYFKVNLYKLKTYHEVVDEIYYNVQHLEPWEKGSRKTSGQTGMCGGVRGVGAGGIVSTAFCILYKLFTLKLTRKQLVGLLNHCDSPYIRALGFMYIRFTQPPADLIDWYEPYLDDEEELDVKAGGGQVLRIGDMLRHMLTKLEWFATLFPRIPVPIQKEIERRLSLRPPALAPAAQAPSDEPVATEPETPAANERAVSPEPRRRRSPYTRESPSGREVPRDSSWDRERQRSRRSRSRERHRERHHRSRSPRDAKPHHSHERSRDEKGREEWPREERARDERSRDERPRDDRSREDRSRDDRSREDRSRDDRSREDKQRDDRSREDRPRDDRSREERSRDDGSRSDRSREDRARDDRMREEKLERRKESTSHRHRSSPERSRHNDRTREHTSHDHRTSSRKERSFSPVTRNHHR